MEKETVTLPRSDLVDWPVGAVLLIGGGRKSGRYRVTAVDGNTLTLSKLTPGQEIRHWAWSLVRSGGRALKKLAGRWP